jgi:hypothetical protein
MLREDRFVLSHRQYAVNPASLRLRFPDPPDSHAWPGWWMADAVWFRRRRGVTVACAGFIANDQDGTPVVAAEFLEKIPTRYSVYGGDCLARWDGTGLWAAGQDPEENARFLALLRPMLAAYPNAPSGYDGWWVF